MLVEKLSAANRKKKEDTNEKIFLGTMTPSFSQQHHFHGQERWTPLSAAWCACFWLARETQTGGNPPFLHSPNKPMSWIFLMRRPWRKRPSPSPTVTTPGKKTPDSQRVGPCPKTAEGALSTCTPYLRSCRSCTEKSPQNTLPLLTASWKCY